MALDILVSILKGKSKEKGSSFELMGQHMKVISILIIFMALALTFGQMAENTLVNEIIIKCMGKEYFNGWMEENFKGIMSKILSMVKGCLNGRMEGNIRDNG